MPRKTKTSKKRPQRGKSPEYKMVENMGKSMETGMKVVGNITMASLGVGIAASVINKI